MSIAFSEFAVGLKVETAFDVLAVAKGLKARGKDVVELQIGDSPFSSTTAAKEAGKAAIDGDQTRYCPSSGLVPLREAVVASFKERFGDRCPALAPENVVVAPGAKVFEQFFCEAFLNPGDEVLVFNPAFPTYAPNIQRRHGSIVFSRLREENEFRPNLDDVAAFVQRPRAKAIFLNSPHNPTGGVATAEDVAGLSNLVRGKNIAVFSDEPYDYMIWRGEHHSPILEPGMLEQTVAVYTFSKTHSMSGWRLGFAVASTATATVLGKLINTALSCVPPFVQIAGAAALRDGAAERDSCMEQFRRKVDVLVDEIERIPELTVVRPAGTFYVFPNVAKVCNRLGITSHGLALFLLEGADEKFGVACLGGECFGEAVAGFLRFSCAEPDDRLVLAMRFLPDAFQRKERVAAFLAERPQYLLRQPYATT